MNIKRCCMAVVMGLCGGPALGASMCAPDIKSASYSYIPSGEQVANNRGYFAIGKNCVASTQLCKDTQVLGISHCSASGIHPASDWEENGGYCWCKFTHVRAPNGYLAPRSGAWVLYPSNSSSYCAASCANLCASYARAYPGFRRALFASLIPNNKMKVLPNSAGLCNRTKYGLLKRGQNHRISFGARRIMACKPSNCCGVYSLRPTGNRFYITKWKKHMDNNTNKHFLSMDDIEKLRTGHMHAPHFSEISDGTDFGSIQGRKIKLNDILGREIIITGFQSAPSRQRTDADYLTIQFLMNGDLYIIWTGSIVLRRMLEKYAGRLPFCTKISRAGDAFVFA